MHWDKISAIYLTMVSISNILITPIYKEENQCSWKN